MLRQSRYLLGSYLLNQRVIADWWHASYREDVHQEAKRRLSIALRLSEELQHGGETSGGVDKTHVGSRAGEEGIEELPFGASSRASPPMTLHEANAIVSTFVSHHNMEDLSSTLQYIREQLGVDLTPYHFHALLRTFSYHHDVTNAAQLLEVMMQSGMTTLETYARIADCIHSLSPADSFSLILRLISLAQEGFGTLMFEETAGSEGDTIAMYAARGEEDQPTTTTTAATGTPRNTSGLSSAAPQSAPLLSSLLHHLATTADGDPVMCFLVALWIQALGVRLGDWDVVHLLCSLLARVEEFPRLCTLLGNFHTYSRGTVSVEAVVQRLEKLGEIPPLLHGEEAGTGLSPLAQLVAAMLASLQSSGADLSVPLVSGWINNQINDVSGVVQAALSSVERFGVGPHGYNSCHLYHTLALLHSTLRDDTAAAEVLQRIAACATEQRQRQEAEQVPMTHCSDAAASGRVTNGEPFQVPVFLLIDIGGLFTRLSAATLNALQLPYCQISRMMVHDFAEVDSTALRKLCCAPVPTTRTLMSVGSYEAFFIRDVAEARAALQRAMEAVSSSSYSSVQRGGGGGRQLPRHVQLMLMQLAEFCGRHPPRNPKYTTAGLEERRKWARYLDARDTSLALFGSSRQSRDSMKHLFYHDNVLPELRSAAVIAQDFSDAYHIFFSPPSAKIAEMPEASLAALQLALPCRRTTLPHINCSGEAVPRYLWDTAVWNPYPHVMLQSGGGACVGNGTTTISSRAAPDPCAAAVSPGAPSIGTAATATEEDEEAQTELENFFVELWETLLDKTTVLGSNEVWFLQNTGMFLLLVRCLLHRLDWEAAAHLTRKMTVYSTYTYQMDQELTTIFKEIGDPAGCLAFKVATKLFDGRINKDGRTKQENFQEEQFS